MTRLEHSIEIDRSLTEVYALAQQVERYPEFLPGYLESRIIGRSNSKVLLERKAIVRGQLREWRSWVSFLNGHQILFVHAAGPLKGMKVVWSFTPISPSKTRLDMVHDIRVPRRWPIGWLLEKTYYGPAVNEMANGVVRDFKQACEMARAG
jgi:ribosome-associated toxin RatA of RatAB toxin-antitoxin module